jgi:Putative binding domain, N-terminal
MRTNVNELRKWSRGISALWFCLFVGAFAASSQTIPLPYVPVTAEYSSSLDRIIFIAANPNQLHIFDPMTNTDTAVNLPKPPLSLSVSLDGQYAAVGHDALISYVNLADAYLVQTLAATSTVTSLVLGNDYIYILSSSSYIQISTGVTGSGGSIFEGNAGRLHPSGAALYTTFDGSPGLLDDINVSTGTPGAGSTGPYWGDYPVCGGVWFSPDGRRVYTGCAVAFQADPQDTSLTIDFGGSPILDTNADGLYWGALAGTSQIRSLTESAALGRIAAIPLSDQYVTPQINDNQVFLYASAYLEPAGIFQLPDFVVNSNSYQAHGQQVFYNQASTALYVVMQADGSSGLLYPYAVQIFPLSNPPACAPTFNSAGTTLSATGTTATVGITAPATCIYQASSDASWIQLISGGYGSGNGTLSYIVRPNTGAQRTGDITLDGQTFAVTQPAASTPSSAFMQLAYSVAGAGYSKSLDKAIVVVSNPKELDIVDPISGSDQVVPLPKPPFFLSVSPDGLSAAVGSDGWVSIIDLSTATITSTRQVFLDAHTILLAGNGYFYAYPLDSWGELFSYQISTGTISIANAIYNGRYPQLYIDGNSFYTEGSKWDISAGPATLITENLSGGCSPFWLTEDGNRMITACGMAYTTSPVPSLDLQYNGSFSNAPYIQWAAESVNWHSTAVIPGDAVIAPNGGDTYLQIYGDAYLGYAGAVSLPTFTVASTPYAGHGRYVFWNSTEDNLIVLEQADTTANLTADYATTVYPMTVPAAGCSFALGATSATVNSYGGLNGVSVTAGAGCAWDAVSNASWITLDSGAVGFGVNAVNYAVALNGGSSSRMGTITIAGQTYTVTQTGAPIAPPAPASVSPGDGAGSTETFTLTFEDSNGYQDLAVVNVLINNFLNGVDACYVAFVPTGATSGELFLVDDAGDGGYASGSPISLPSSNTLQNSQCNVSATGSSVSASGNTLTLILAVTFTQGFSGNKILYTAARSNSQSSGWQALGTWDVPETAPTGPAVGGVSPTRSSTNGQTYTFTFTDTNGYADLAVVDILTNNFLNGIGACYVAFAPSGATTGSVYLVDDAGDPEGPFAGSFDLGTPGAIASNSQCTISGTGSSVSASGNTLRLTLAITFNSSFAGNQVFYLAARNSSTGNSGWQAVGSVTVP